MKPSCAVTKLIDAQGRRPSKLNTSAEAHRRAVKRRGSRFAPPEIAHGVAKLIIPLAPAGRKAADLISAGTDIPGLGDQFDGGENRILAARLQETALIVEAIGFPRQNCAQIEAEAIDMRLLDPVAQAVGNHLEDATMRDIQGVSGAGIIYVVALLLGHQPVVAGIVDALERERRTALVAFGGVVVDDIQNDFESRFVKAGDHLLEFAQTLPLVGSIARIGSEESDAVVSPVIGEALFAAVGCR